MRPLPIMLLLLSRSAKSDECRKSKNARPPHLPRLLFLPKLALVVGLQKPPRLILLILLLLLLELLPRCPLPEALLLMCPPELPLAELLSRGIRPMPPPLLLLLLRPFMRKG